MLTSNKINHKNCFDYIWDEVKKNVGNEIIVVNM